MGEKYRGPWVFYKRTEKKTGRVQYFIAPRQRFEAARNDEYVREVLAESDDLSVLETMEKLAKETR